MTATVTAAPQPIARERPETDARWDSAMICASGYLLVSVGRVHQLFPVLEPARPALVCALGALWFILLDRRRVDGLWQISNSTTGRWLFAFTVWMACCVPGALNIGWSLGVFGGFLKSALMCVVLAAVPRGPRDAERLVVAYFVGAALYAGVVLARFHVGVASWRLDALYYYDANDFCVLAVTSLAPAMHMLVTPKLRWQRVLALAGLPALALVIVWSGSRGGFLAMLVVGYCIVVGTRSISLGWRLAGVAAVAVVLATSASTTYWQKMDTILHPNQDYNATGESGRLQIWQRGLGYMMDRPVFGVGPGGFPIAEGTLSAQSERQDWGVGFKWSAAHNSFVQTAAELGVPGLVMFVGLLWSAAAGLHVVRRGQPGVAFEIGERRARLARALQVSMLGFAVGAFFLSLAYNEIPYALIALSMGLRRVAGPRYVPRRPSWALSR